MLKILTLVTAAVVALTIPLDAQESGPSEKSSKPRRTAR